MKLDILFHYNVDEQTGEITFIGKEEITVDTATSTKRQAVKAAKVDNNTDPLITLDSNKLVLTSGAVDLMQICAEVAKTKKVLYISGEESAGQVKLRAERLGADADNLNFGQLDIIGLCKRHHIGHQHGSTRRQPANGK